MWLIDTETLALQHFVFEKAPRYAILSHTWGDQEVSLAEFQHLDDATKAKAGFSKIEKTCWLAKQEGIRYAWVDTCCIDKSSSAELSESINSMFAYYHNSTICYAYIFDWPTDTREAAIISNRDLSQCRWFTRGWTLQELIAPREVRFYDATWTPRGHKSDPSLVFRLSILTGIPIEVLQTGGGVSLSGIPVAQRMSWASGRETTRTEDMAYCLLGIFQINIPLLYGEGQGAFRRLQEEIIRSSTDLSIFAWKEPSSGWPGIRPFRPSVSRIFANHPRLFTDLGRCSLLKSPLFSPPEITATNRGLRFHGRFFELPKSRVSSFAGSRTESNDLCSSRDIFSGFVVCY
ncbi:heterokaryon incompatibility protein-domain-containing protein [Echria macrotheca]|uniref:Heterokaryon incompatibility protein-domain-containing protein n=1 Tax=Echria macrotheca TaxID=438768 RepID=A0AAJ0B6L9_9PEZI|nr:heterokaryon incompatibility protein-domain-containing protein [Echria macrotheca]